MPKFTDRLKHAWNAFRNNRDPTNINYNPFSYSSSIRPDRVRMTRGNERSIVTAIYNRIAVDVSSIMIQHVRVDENGQYLEDVKSPLNEALTLSANTDQTGRQFVMDVVMSMFDEGSVCIVPTETDIDPFNSGSFDILSMRTGKITQWYPQHVKVNVYNENSGKKEEIIMPKRSVCIIENPFYSVMNEPSSTMQRLIRKLNLLDAIDEQSSSGKLDLIIQLPYVIKTDARKAQAEQRRKDLEAQLAGSKYGIAYTDGTEKVTQLNRSVENNLMEQIDYLTKLLYSQLGITEEIMNGTANEVVMLNYQNRTLEPILSAICDELKRKFLTKTARTRGHSIVFFRDPFKLVPVQNIATIADTFTRNEILSSNELRRIVGFKPSGDPKADMLINSNLNEPAQQMQQEEGLPMEGMPPGQEAPNMQPQDPEPQMTVDEAYQILLEAGYSEEDLQSATEDDIIAEALQILQQNQNGS